MVPISEVEQACAVCDGQIVALHDQAGASGKEGKLDMRGLTGYLSPAQAAILDKATPPWLRVKVLERDGHGCRCCGSRRQVQVHHIWYRKNGGRTRAYNLISLCARCHALTHVGLLILVGKRESEIVFTNREGQRLHDPGGLVEREALVEMRRVFAKWVSGEVAFGPGEGAARGDAARDDAARDDAAAAMATAGSEAAGDSVVRWEDLPDEIDSAWWARHEGLITMKRGCGLEFREGFARKLDGLAERDMAERNLAEYNAAERNAAENGAAVKVQGSGELVDAEEMSRWESESLNILGREDVVSRLRAEAAGCRARGKAFPHMLLAGPPGTGKTSLAVAVAKAQGLRLHRAMGTLIQDVPALLRLVTGLGEGDCLFLDEIHAIPCAVLETLYEAMEGGRLSLTLHCGNRSRCVGLRLPKLTVLAATTEPADLPAALKSRFGIIEYLSYYKNEELSRILEVRARAEGVELANVAASRLAQCSRGTPREALGLLDSVFNQLAAQGLCAAGTVRNPVTPNPVTPNAVTPSSAGAKGSAGCAGTTGLAGTELGRLTSQLGGLPNLVTREQVDKVLERLGYNEEGLGKLEQRYLALLRAQTGPIALHRLAMGLGCPEATVRDEIEPRLARMGYVEFTARGRVAGRESTVYPSGQQKAMVGDRVSEADAISSRAWGWPAKAPESGSAALAVVRGARIRQHRFVRSWGRLGSDGLHPQSEGDVISDQPGAQPWTTPLAWDEKAPESGSTALAVVWGSRGLALPG